ncbi:MAG: type II CAAX endopeptidase family protein [Imperialibacter sp.]|uniref:CPBP family intramembrane glutamic endopeptidase n=1 Tax=Imperialibacter sp. TaxID=2038411 RepID=UPI0032ED8456
MEPTNPTYYPTIKQSFGLLVLWFLISILTAIPLGVISALHLNIQNVTTLKSAGTLLAYCASFVWIIYVAKKRIKTQGLWELKWKHGKVPFMTVVVGLIMTLALSVLIDPITELIPMPESIKKMFEALMQPNIFSFITIVIMAPLLEEAFFRGVVLEGFLRNYSPWKAIIWSSMIFGAAHMNPWQTISASLIGVLIGWIYVKTNSLIPGIILHFFNNLIGFSVMAFVDQDMDSLYLSKVIESELAYFGLLGLAAGVLVLGYIWLDRRDDLVIT